MPAVSEPLADRPGLGKVVGERDTGAGAKPDHRSAKAHRIGEETPIVSALLERQRSERNVVEHGGNKTQAERRLPRSGGQFFNRHGFDFTRSDRLVCTEVIYRAYDGIGGLHFDLTRRAGRMTLAAVDLLQMALARQGFEAVAVFAPSYAPELLAGGQAEEILSRTLAP